MCYVVPSPLGPRLCEPKQANTNVVYTQEVAFPIMDVKVYTSVIDCCIEASDNQRHLTDVESKYASPVRASQHSGSGRVHRLRLRDCTVCGS
jgi:hypothetical protein